jgi:hypothetical protein
LGAIGASHIRVPGDYLLAPHAPPWHAGSGTKEATMRPGTRARFGSIAFAGVLLLATLAIAPAAYAGSCQSSSSTTVSRATASDKLTITVYFTTKGYCSGSYFIKQTSTVTKIVATYSNTQTGFYPHNTINAAAVYDRWAADGPWCSSPLQGSCWANFSSQYCIAYHTPACPMTRVYYPGVTIPYNTTDIVRIHCVCGNQGFNLYNEYNTGTKIFVADPSF